MTGTNVIVANYGGPVENDVLGSLICGGADDDTLVANGSGHQCMDGGPGQVVSGSEKDCTYANSPDDLDGFDVGTARSCAASVKTSTNGTLLSDTPPCGCDS